MFNLNYNFMAKFTDKQVLQLMTDELHRRLKSDSDYLPKLDSEGFKLSIQTRINLLKDLISSLEFYSNYEFD